MGSAEGLGGSQTVLPVTYLVDRVLEGRDLLLQVVQAPASQVVSHSDCLGQKHGGGLVRKAPELC